MPYRLVGRQAPFDTAQILYSVHSVHSTPKRKKSQHLTKFQPIDKMETSPRWISHAVGSSGGRDLQTAASAEAVMPTPSTKRGHVTMCDATQLAHSGSERQVTRI
jgi:hypothetical protein